jgi:hypothetical protein
MERNHSVVTPYVMDSKNHGLSCIIDRSSPKFVNFVLNRHCMLGRIGALTSILWDAAVTRHAIKVMHMRGKLCTVSSAGLRLKTYCCCKRPHHRKSKGHHYEVRLNFSSADVSVPPERLSPFSPSLNVRLMSSHGDSFTSEEKQHQQPDVSDPKPTIDTIDRSARRSHQPAAAKRQSLFPNDRSLSFMHTE